ncbi:hypothetical protein L3C95_11145 [Chitinophaga filiformis]|uniref:hypothetical protein n=1 Tax=Chitinophaga filiformis TaxID=104663 RepID=UPI001F408F3E|nr:hypothetical protein [Chitinophaga filiformis]MCF6402647.1 hypothetical protein [Chitinophaga filiformis]MCF6403435.1 hypothetical protein [Chitinophaga filiformis]
MNRSRILYLCTVALLLPLLSSAQQVDLEHIRDLFGKGKPLKVNGGVNASTVFNSGSGSGRQPFNWYLNGSVNMNILGRINLPFSFNLTNAGAGYSYPTMPNRLSLHPTYKGVTAHIGDVAMSFSPYTLNGHQFTGVGLDIAPQQTWSISVMYGRLLRAVDYDSTNRNILPTYKRMAYGAKLALQQQNYSLSLNFLRAQDFRDPMQYIPDTLHIFPRANLAVSLAGMLRPAKGLELTVEYANSAMKLDKRDFHPSSSDRGNLLENVFMYDIKNTQFFKAIRAGMNYTFHKSVIGLGYERIDPGYQTLGTYYMNNDMENITVNLSQPLLHDKATISGNVGYQRDDLNNTKAGATFRMVSAINASYMPNEKWNANFTYSNFQTFTHIKPQFDYINQTNPYENMDTLNFKQISQSAGLTLTYMIKANKTKSHNINLNLNVQDAADIQNDVLWKGNGSRFYNSSTAYTLLLIPRQMSITGAFNLSYNTIGRDEFLTLGPTFGVNTRLFDKKVTAGFNSSYNSSTNNGQQQGQVLNFRANAAYLFMKKHNLNMNAVHQTRWSTKGTASNVTATVGYSYSF